ncbi:P-loop containing nucleoside triphosphate hydrolase protein [Aspergillus ambiguus]|uniref:DEAD/DEAH box helicase n=1 Tax=Aspergillus ambiguus TaxID=176160 RepID=UPI003CCD8EE4
MASQDARQLSSTETLQRNMSIALESCQSTTEASVSTPVTASSSIVSASGPTATPADTSSAAVYGFIQNLDIYIPVGVLKKTNLSHSGPSIIPEQAYREVAGPEEDGFPRQEIANLEKHHWIWTSAYPCQGRPNWSFVRVYVLPDDVGRKIIPRSSSALRRALKSVMAKIDRSPEAWAGVLPSLDRDVEEIGGEDESLWYIFNTLKDPEPQVERMRNPYARNAMEDILVAGATEEISVPGLKTPLYPYQRRSAATMIQREAQPASMLDPRLQRRIAPTGREYYYDKEEGRIVCEEKLYSEARGGILAETMGCGKTLICLAVVLATRGHFPEIPLEYQQMENPIRHKTARLVTMAASAAGRLSLPWKRHFDNLESIGEHYGGCVNACEENRGSYVIPPPPARHSGRSAVAYPRPPPQELLLGHGTLIVVPPNLMNHWEHEIQNHTEGLKVLALRTPSDVTPSVETLLEFDIVLFSRTRFEKEAGEVVNNRRHSVLPVKSKLTKIHWLRIIVDEGHNVAGDGHKTNMVHILNQLHVERRWVVSGTPSNNMYGVEVSLASRETHTSDTDLSEATAAVLSGRRKTGSAIENELKDLDKLRHTVVEFLDLKPWSNSRVDDPANWTTYMKPVGENGKRRKAPSLRATLQSLVVRHRMETINSEITLPPLYNTVVRLDPTFYDRLNLNLFIFILAVNVITSERKDQDYMFHTRNRTHLSQFISNLRQAGFWWAGSEGDLPGTIDIANKYLDNNRAKMTDDDIARLIEGIRVARIALDCGSWNAFKNLHELGVFVENFPSHAQSLWALDSSSSAPTSPLLLGITQAHQAQKFVTSHLHLPDPAEGLAGAGIKVRSELAEHANRSDPTKKSTPDKQARTKSPKKAHKTFTKNLFKTLPPESPLARTKLVATASAKLTYLLDQVNALHKEEQILIFYDNNNTAFWIAEGLELLGISFRIYANTLKPAVRTAYLKLFRESEEVRVLLMDLAQASHGLHIANASRVFIVNPIWQPNVESQAIKRAHRIGQRRPVFVETLVLKDTLEDRMLKRRKAMSDMEIQRAEKDLLDDQTMSSIIEAERFLPIAEDEASASVKLAYLRNPPGFFDRHKLALADDFYDNPPMHHQTSLTSTSTSTPKRKRVAIVDRDTSIGDEPEIVSPKRPRPTGHVGFLSPTISSGDAAPVVQESRESKPKKTVSIFG